MNKIFTKYSSMSAPVKASLWFVFCSVLQRGISMLTTPIFTRILTQEEYGTISVYNSWLGIITIIVTLELATGVFNKAMIKYKDDRDGYASSTLFLSSCVTVAFFVVYIVGYEYWNSLFELSTVFMVMMFTDIFFTEAMLFWTVRKRFEFEYKKRCCYYINFKRIGICIKCCFCFSEFELPGRVESFGHRGSACCGLWFGVS